MSALRGTPKTVQGLLQKLETPMGAWVQPNGDYLEGYQMDLVYNHNTITLLWLVQIFFCGLFLKLLPQKVRSEHF